MKVLSAALVKVFEGHMPTASLRVLLSRVHHQTHKVRGSKSGGVYCMTQDEFMAVVLQTAIEIRRVAVLVRSCPLNESPAIIDCAVVFSSRSVSQKSLNLCRRRNGLTKRTDCWLSG